MILNEARRIGLSKKQFYRFRKKGSRIEEDEKEELDYLYL